jgi:NADP-dependent 3-hydroxy acid dehydrogenase YdfG
MISPTTKVVCISASITNSADLEKLVATVNAEFGGADVLVNAAGVLNGRGNIGEGSIDGWWNTMV